MTTDERSRRPHAAVPDPEQQSDRLDRILLSICRHPWQVLVHGWNWKAAVLSSTLRAAIFLLANLPAGLAAGLRAMAIEFAFRAIASGVLGSLTQTLRFAQPLWAANLAALIMMPALGHSAEYLVHSLADTPRLGASISASIAFTCVSTLFNLFAMRRGVLVVGAGGQSLWRDLRALPHLMIVFAGSLALASWRLPRQAWSLAVGRRDGR